MQRPFPHARRWTRRQGHQCSDVDLDQSGSCATAGGAWSDTDHCPDAMKAGGCLQISSGHCKVQWYYMPLNTTHGVMTTCMLFGGTFIAP